MTPADPRPPVPAPRRSFWSNPFPWRVLEVLGVLSVAPMLTANALGADFDTTGSWVIVVFAVVKQIHARLGGEHDDA